MGNDDDDDDDDDDDVGCDNDVCGQTPEEVARQAVDADVHCIGVSSQAAAHNALVPALVTALQEADASHILLVVGGVIPPKDYTFLKSCGVAAIFGPGTRLPVAALDTLDAIEASLVPSSPSHTTTTM